MNGSSEWADGWRIHPIASTGLLVASDEGVVRIWRNMHEEGKQTLVTAWVANPQPEVFYGPQATSSATTAASSANYSQQQQQPLDNHVITPSHSYQEQSLSGSALAPQARLLHRGSNAGVGFTPMTGGGILTGGMRHSASTPALALSAHGGAASSSRSGSLISPAGSLLPGSSGSGSPSPTLRPSISPGLGPASSGAINIPSYSLAGGQPPQNGAQQQQGRLSPGHAPPAKGYRPPVHECAWRWRARRAGWPSTC